MLRLCLLVGVLLACSSALSLKLHSPPESIPKPGPPQPDENGVFVEQVVNVHKNALILVQSTATDFGAKQRALLRQTWMQALNRSSEFAMPKEQRRAYSVWFIVAHDDASDMQLVQDEGKLHGDLLIVKTPNTKPVEQFGSLLRWVRVAYFNRCSFVLFTRDTSFVSLYNLHDYCVANLDKKFLYSGHVNSFELADPSYGHKYYAPFVQDGGILISQSVIEIIAREMEMVKPLRRPDATWGNLLRTFEEGKPQHSAQFVPDLKSVYAAVDAPIVVNGVPQEMMETLSRPVFKNGKWMTVPLPAQAAEFETRTIYIDPHPKERVPECDKVGDALCTISSLKALDATN